MPAGQDGSNTVDPIVVTAARWGWGYIGDIAVQYGGSAGIGGNPMLTLQYHVVQYAAGKITLEAALANDPNAKDWKNTAQSILSNLRWMVLQQQSNTNTVVDRIGTSNDMKGTELGGWLDKISIVLTTAPITNGAATYTDSAGNKTIYLNPTELSANRHFADATKDMVYVIFHELGHSNPESISLYQSLTQDGSYGAGDIQIVESYANAQGGQIAKAVGYANYPTAAELAPYNGMPAPGFTLPGATNANGAPGDSILALDDASGPAGHDSVGLVGASPAPDAWALA